MKNSFSIFSLIIIGFSITSCSTTAFQLSDLHSLSKNQHQLLALEPVLKSNANIVTPAYYDEDDYVSDNSISVNSEGVSLFLDGFNRSNASMTIDSDIRALFENDVKENITNPYGSQYGWIILNPKTLERKHLARHLSVINFMTLGIANLFGVNIRKYKTFIELEVEIFNANDNLIGRYVGTGEHITKVNIYKKNQADHYRMAVIEVTKQALAEIKRQINVDSDRLNTNLKETGVVKKTATVLSDSNDLK